MSVRKLAESKKSVVARIETLSDTQFAYLLLFPIFVVMGAIVFWPLLSTFEMSLRADSLIGSSNIGEFVWFENYVALLTGERNPVLSSPFVDFSNPLQSGLIVTVLFAGVSVVLETIIGFTQALVLDKDFRGRRWVRTAIILPWAIPIVIQGMIFYLMFQPGIGFAIEPLHELGLITSTPLNNTADSLLIVIIADVWKTSAFMALLILAGLQSIDRNLYNVAEVMGASHWQRFKRITLPLVLPSVLIAMLFRTISAMRVYGLIETTAGCSRVPSLSCMVVSSFGARRYGTSAAIAFLTAAIIAIVVSIYIVKFSDANGGGV